MKMTAAEIIIKILEEQDISIVTGIPGGSNLPLYDALSKSSIRHILARHEQGAGFIAQGMARSTGKTAVCLATSGPGAANLVTAIADAMHDSVPIIAITGQVSRSLIGTNAFQEIDFLQITAPITKKNFFVKNADECAPMLRQAFNIAAAGRPGPVVVDVPKDVLQQITEYTPENVTPHTTFRAIDDITLEKAASMINDAHRPFILAGGGITHSGAHKELKIIAEKSSIPVAHTLMGIGCFDQKNSLSLGMIGMHGSPAANTVSEEADLLIALGVRFNDRSTGLVNSFLPRADVLHIDIDPTELGKLRHTALSIEGDLRTVLTPLSERINENRRTSWHRTIGKCRSRFKTGEKRNDRLHPASIIRTIIEAGPGDAVIVTDVGQHQMWAAQEVSIFRPRSFLTSGGLGTMGFGLPAAIGASLAHPEKRIICITGDGSLQMNIQELATLAELNLPVSIFLMNNGHLGLVRQQQELFYGGNIYASEFTSGPDFSAIAKGYAISSSRADTPEAIHQCISRAFSCSGPFLAELMIQPDMHVLPIVSPGKSNMHMIGVEYA